MELTSSPSQRWYWTAILHFAALIFLTSSLQAQIVPFKLGYVDPADLAMEECPIDPDASAFVLFDHGVVRFVGRTNSFGILSRYHQQIKILKKDGLSRADFRIKLESNGEVSDQLVDVAAITYNLENGTVVQTPLKKSDLLEQRQPNGDMIVRFGMPSARVGSVVEVVYTISSPFFLHPRQWFFQGTSPVRRSEYTMSIPEFFEYKVRTVSYMDFAEERSKQVQESYQFLEYGEMKGTALSTYWRMEDIPSFHPEVFMGAPSNYMAHLEFELAAVQYPKQERKVYSGDWSTFTEDALKHEKLGLKIDDAKSFESLLPEILKGAVSEQDKAKAIYHHLRARMKWNGYQGLFSERKPKEIYESRVGSIPDLHVTLLAMLRGAGVNAQPVFMSTTANGAQESDLPLVADYDYLAVALKDTSGWVFLDISDPFRAFGTLPATCLGGKGVVLAETGAELVNILRKEKLVLVMRAKLRVAENGNLEGSFTRELFSLAAHGFLIEDESERDPAYEGWEISVLTSKAGAIHEDKQSQEGQMSKSMAWLPIGNAAILQPLSGIGYEENIFAAETRAYPVDIGFPLKQIYQLEIEVPEGWVVDVPMAPAYVVLPNSAGRFRFLYAQTDNIITLSSTLALDWPHYGPEYYAGLREMYATAVDRHAATIVFKKKP